MPAVTRKRKREALREQVWGNADLRRLVFEFFVSPTRVFMARAPRLPYVSTRFWCAVYERPRASVVVPLYLPVRLEKAGSYIQLRRDWHNPYSNEIIQLYLR